MSDATTREAQANAEDDNRPHPLDLLVEQKARIAELEATLMAALNILGHPDDETVKAMWAILERK